MCIAHKICNSIWSIMCRTQFIDFPCLHLMNAYKYLFSQHCRNLKDDLEHLAIGMYLHLPWNTKLFISLAKSFVEWVPWTSIILSIVKNPWRCPALSGPEMNSSNFGTFCNDVLFSALISSISSGLMIFSDTKCGKRWWISVRVLHIFE